MNKKQIKKFWSKIFGYQKGNKVALIKEQISFIYEGERLLTNWVQFPKGAKGIIEKVSNSFCLVHFEAPLRVRGFRSHIKEEDLELI